MQNHQSNQRHLISQQHQHRQHSLNTTTTTISSPFRLPPWTSFDITSNNILPNGHLLLTSSPMQALLPSKSNQSSIVNATTTTPASSSSSNGGDHRVQLPSSMSATTNHRSIFIAISIVSGASSLIAWLSLQLLLNSFRSTIDVTTTYAMICTQLSLSLSLLALFIGIQQLVFALQIASKPASIDRRLQVYLQRTMFLRLIAFLAFFVSIPFFLCGVLATMLTLSSSFGHLPTSICAIIISIILAICMLTMAHAAYVWLFSERIHGRRYDGQCDNKHQQSPTINDNNNNLSTLV